MTPVEAEHEEDPRVRRARRLVARLAILVGVSLFTALVFGVYNCATDRPAREIFFEPRPAAAGVGADHGPDAR